ncbi:hypothetical protein K6U44_02300, partial [Vibrio parahaemolyticus]|uniref:helix-turn-helix domain-containing protein n=1 Tax=Vibrio parahaemolyticus TaxID=670 RepID=UPI001EECC6B5
VMDLLYQPAPSSPNLTQLLPELKRAIVEEVLIHTYGNQTRAAAILGMNRETLRRLYLQKKSRSANQPHSCKNNDINGRMDDHNI